MIRKSYRCFSSLYLMFIFFVGCIPTWGYKWRHESTDDPTKTSDYTHTLPSTPSITLTPMIQNFWISPAVPVKLAEEAGKLGYVLIDNADEAEIKLGIVDEALDSSTTWFYAVVAPFPTIIDDISFDELRGAWRGEGYGAFTGVPLRMNDSTLRAISSILGEPSEGSVLMEASDRLLESAWAAGTAWAIVPFEELDSRWKVLMIDGQSLIHNDFNPAIYPLQVSFSLQPALFGLPITNRDPSNLTTVVMTGVTALVRSTAARMVTKGLTYPGEEVRDSFRAADLLHISNEIPFYEECPDPLPITATLRFCSDPSYIALLEDIGTDIVELTGNHFQDYGSEATLYTLDMYDARDWIYFGGGRNQEEAKQAKIITHNGNKLAFIGCNPSGPDFAWAGIDRPGAAQCDFEFMYSEITRLRSEGYLPIVTFQHYEYYSLFPSREQIGDFHNMTAAGAVIVSGSQSHFPQYMEFDKNAYIHYGLGNLFFDQMDYPAVGTRREFADRHVFYDGKYIGTELLTFMLEDYARPRVMESWEREQFLMDVFQAAGWEK